MSDLPAELIEIAEMMSERMLGLQVEPLAHTVSGADSEGDEYKFHCLRVILRPSYREEYTPANVAVGVFLGDSEDIVDAHAEEATQGAIWCLQMPIPAGYEPSADERAFTHDIIGIDLGRAEQIKQHLLMQSVKTELDRQQDLAWAAQQRLNEAAGIAHTPYPLPDAAAPSSGDSPLSI